MQTTHHTIRTHTLVVLAELHLVYITITASTLFYKQLHLSVFEKSYFIIVLQKISCTRQFESQLSLRSFALSFRVKDCLSALLHLFGFQFDCPLKCRHFKGQPFIPHTRSGYSSASSSYLGTSPRCHTSLPNPIQPLPWLDCNNRWQYRQDVLA